MKKLFLISFLIASSAFGEGLHSAAGGNTYTANQYGVVISGTSTIMTVLAPDASTSKVLRSGGASANPTWLPFTSANTVSTLVERDGSGNFSAGTITAALTGSASGNTSYSPNQYGVVLSGAGNTMSVLAPDASTTKVLTSGGASANPTWTALPASGDFSGPASAVSGNIVSFNGTGGKTGKDSGVPVGSVGASGILSIGTLPNANLQTHNVSYGFVAGPLDWSTNNVNMGNYSLASGDGIFRNIAVGTFAGRYFTGNFGDHVLVGHAVASGTGFTGDADICIGAYACDAAGFNFSSVIALGKSVAPTASNQFLAGGPVAYINDAYFGKGVTHATPVAVTLQGTGGVGTNINGAKVTIAAGKGTGTGTSVVAIATGTTLGSGTTLQTLVDRIFADGTGKVTIGATGDTTSIHGLNGAVATTVGAAGGGSALPATPIGYLRVSINGGATVKVPYFTD